jgi:hypothetical protein
LQALPFFVEACLQHLCDLVEVNSVYHIRRRRVVMVLMSRHRWNPGSKEYGVKDRVSLPGVGEFKLVGDGSNFTDNRERAIALSFELLCRVTKFAPERYMLSAGL